MVHRLRSSRGFQGQYTRSGPYSPTVLGDFLRCPRYWRFKYLERRVIPSSPILNFGIAFHEFAARVSRRVLAGETQQSDLRGEIEECAQKSFQEAVRRGLLNPEERATFLTRCRNTLPFFARLAGNLWKAVKVEFYCAVDRNYATTAWRKAYLRGRIDLALFSGDRALIVDWKMGGSPFRLSEPDKLQLHIYGLLVFKNFRKVSNISTVLFYAKDKRLFRISISRLDEEAIQRRVEGLIVKIESEESFRPRPGRHCGWCAFKSDC